MKPLTALILVTDFVLARATEESEQLALYKALSILFDGLSPERAAGLRHAALALLAEQEARAAREDAQGGFRALLHEAALPDAGPKPELSAEHRRRGGIFSAETRGERAGRMLADFDLYREDRGAAGMQALDVHGFSCVWTIGKEKDFTRPQFEDALRQAEDDAGLLSTAGC